MDIVERLQEMPELTSAQYWEAQASMWHENYKEAADETERLRKALQAVVDAHGTGQGIGAQGVGGWLDQVRQALENK